MAQWTPTQPIKMLQLLACRIFNWSIVAVAPCAASEQYAWRDHLDAAGWEEGGLQSHPCSSSPLLHVQRAGLWPTLRQDTDCLSEGSIQNAWPVSVGAVDTWWSVSLVFIPVSHGQNQGGKGAGPDSSQHVVGSVCPREEVQLLLWRNLQCVAELVCKTRKKKFFNGK